MESQGMAFKDRLRRGQVMPICSRELKIHGSENGRRTLKSYCVFNCLYRSYATYAQNRSTGIKDKSGNAK